MFIFGFSNDYFNYEYQIQMLDSDFQCINGNTPKDTITFNDQRAVLIFKKCLGNSISFHVVIAVLANPTYSLTFAGIFRNFLTLRASIR